MQPVMGVSDVVEFERTLGEKGLRAQELMRRAGAVVALQTAKLVDRGSVVVLCGMGNNGGDGWVAADSLARHGYEVNVVSAATPAVIKGEVARRMAARTAEMGVPVHVNPDYDELCALLAEADVVVDAVFGTGFKGAMPNPYDRWVEAVDEAFSGMVVAVDVPSGINADTGMSAGAYFKADVTVTMFAMKPGLISGEGRAAAGTVIVASLATDDEGLSELSDAAAAFALDDADYLDVIPEPDPLQDKYTRGRVLVVAGSVRYPGAAVMAALSAARAGAGYVTLAVPAPVVPIVQAHLLSIPVVGLPADEEGSFGPEAADRVGALAVKADVVLAGPGMTTSFGAAEVVRQLLAAPTALVLDADALNVLVKICLGSAEGHPEPLRREAPLVLTPHRRELARLVACDPAGTASLAQAMHVAQQLAWSVGSADFAVIAKGPVTAVATIDSTVVPEPGPHALATAGTGDVLAGIVASMLAQRLALTPGEGVGSSDLLMLMAAADRVHAVAGFLAADEYGSRGVVATDVVAKVGRAVDALVAAAERAYEEAGEDAGSRLEGDLAFEDESRITPPPEVERLIRADAAARVVQAPGELGVFGDDLEEPAVLPAPPAAVPKAEPVAAAPVTAAPAGEPAVRQAAPSAAAAPLVPPFLTVVAPPAAPGQAQGQAQGHAQPGAEPPAEQAAAPTAQPDEPVAAEAAEQGGPVPASASPAAAPARPASAPAAAADATTVMPAIGSSAAPEAAAAARAEGAAAGATGQLPPFLARAVAVAPAVSVDEGAQRPVEAPVQETAYEPTPEELERLRIEAFHERATLRIDDDAVTPMDERPSAKPRRRR